MKKETKENLLRKGWNKDDLNKADTILNRSNRHDIFFSKIVFWSALLVIILGNVIFSFVLLPLLIFLNKGFLITLIIIVAITIGFIYNFLITDIGLIGSSHHLIASIIIPIIAIINLVGIVLISNKFISSLNIQNSPHNPWILSIIFAVSFITPFMIDKIIKKGYN